jgi:Flp pilus assembly protein TadG
MLTRSHLSSKRRWASGGNSLVESAFTLLPTFALLFAFIDFGLMLYRWSSIQNAVREGVRYAITFQTSGGLGQAASIKQVVQRYSMGIVTTADSPQHIFVKFYSPGTPDTAIPAGGNLPGNIVEVSVQNLSFAWVAPLSGSYGGAVPFFRMSAPLNLKAFALDLLGGYPVGVNSVAE